MCAGGIPDAFFAGLIAGEGSFGITRNNAGASWTCSFSLTMRDDDTALLAAGRQWLDGGRLRSLPARANSRPQTAWKITSMRDCARLVEALSVLPLLGKKAGDFRVWRSAVRTWTGGGNSRWPVLERHAECLRLHRDFDREADHTRVEISAPYVKAFLAGFVTAEGHFGASRAGTPSFVINLRADDAALARLLQRRFGFGYIASIRARASSRPGISWRVGKRRELRQLVAILDGCPPRGRAGRVYRRWRELVLPADYPQEHRRVIASELVAERMYRHVTPGINSRDREAERRARCREALTAWATSGPTAHTTVAYERWRLERRTSTPSRNTVAVVFGSWRDGLLAAGIGQHAGLPLNPTTLAGERD